jgi:hypothetical protein
MEVVPKGDIFFHFGFLTLTPSLPLKHKGKGASSSYNAEAFRFITKRRWIKRIICVNKKSL